MPAQHRTEPAALQIAERFSRVAGRHHVVLEPIRVHLEQPGVDNATRVGLADEIEGAATEKYVDAAPDFAGHELPPRLSGRRRSILRQPTVGKCRLDVDAPLLAQLA